MTIRVVLLAGLLSIPLATNAGLAADTGKQSLVDAARAGDREALIAVLKASPKEDVVGPKGVAALIWAAYRNDLPMTDLLLGVGVNPKGANEYGASALYAAAALADATMTTKLLAAGADANATLLSGETPLMEAARRGNIATVGALLSGGAKPNAQESNGGQTALMWALSERHASVAAELIKRGADVHARTKRGFTPLMFTAQQGDAESARVLIAAGAKPNDVMPRTGFTPLIIASAMGRTDVAAALLQNGADPNVTDANGFTALHHAVKDRDAVALVQTLLKHKAKPDVRLKQEKVSAVTVAGIVLQGATPLMFAAEANNLEAIMALTEGGANPQIPTEMKTTPLMLAVGAGVDVVRPRPPEERATAIETAKFLIEKGADIHATGQFGWTALHGAAYQGMNEVIEYLVSKGANLEARDDFGQTPLSIAHAAVTKKMDLGTNVPQIPRIYRKDTIDTLLKLGAIPLEQSGVDISFQRTGE